MKTANWARKVSYTAFGIVCALAGTIMSYMGLFEVGAENYLVGVFDYRILMFNGFGIAFLMAAMVTAHRE